jgi:hypothetical protein
VSKKRIFMTLPAGHWLKAGIDNRPQKLAQRQQQQRTGSNPVLSGCKRVKSRNYRA